MKLCMSVLIVVTTNMILILCTLKDHVDLIEKLATIIGVGIAAVGIWFAIEQLKQTATTSKNALAVSLPYLFVSPNVEHLGKKIRIIVTNHGQSVCTISERWITSIEDLPRECDWQVKQCGKLVLEVVKPNDTAMGGEIQPGEGHTSIIGCVTYVNLFMGVQCSWFRFDLEHGKWVQRGGMYWNAMTQGKPRHHNDC